MMHLYSAAFPSLDEKRNTSQIRHECYPVLPEKKRQLKIDPHFEKKKKKSMIIKTNSLLAVLAEISSTPTQNPQELGSGIIDVFSLFRSEKEKKERQQALIAFVLVFLFSLCVALRIAQRGLILEE